MGAASIKEQKKNRSNPGAYFISRMNSATEKIPHPRGLPPRVPPGIFLFVCRRKNQKSCFLGKQCHYLSELLAPRKKLTRRKYIPGSKSIIPIFHSHT
jgi:hypothetical protein